VLQPADLFSAMRDCGVSSFTGVPDSLLKDFCAYVADHATRHVVAANEGAAVAFAVGHHLATGGVPLVYLQNSGLGHIVNPLLSLADKEVYAIPMIVFIGWRGEPGVDDEPQHRKQGRVMLAMLEAMELPHRILSDTRDDAVADIEWAVRRAREGNEPVALVVRKGTFARYVPARQDPEALPMTREEAIERIVAALDSEDAVVATTGMISRELFEIRQRRAEPLRDFLTVGSMGHASAIACGIAGAVPARQIFCLDGDGAMLMHMGSMAVHGQFATRNFKHIILNNGCHDSVGGQPTVAFDVRLDDIARVCGYKVIDTVADAEGVAPAMKALRSCDGPALLEIRVRKGARAGLGRPTSSPFENKELFVRFLRFGDD
jgi:phosphonopyruvate decarboxylase